MLMDDEPGKNAEEIESNKESVTEATESPQGYEAKNHRRPSSKLWTPYGDQEVKGEEPPGEGAEEEELSEEELRERIEKALEKITVTDAVSYTHLRAHETRHDLVCRLLLEKKKKKKK